MFSIKSCQIITYCFLGVFMVLLAIFSWRPSGQVSADQLGPNDHINPDDILIWKYLGDYSVNDFAIDPIDNSNIYIATGYPTAVAFSYDFGSTWMTRTVGAQPFSDGLAIAIDPLNPSRIYLSVTENRIYRSINSGNTWQRVDAGVTNGTRVSELFVHPITPTIILGGSYSGPLKVYRSTNGGNSWSAISATTDPGNNSVVKIFSHPTIHKRIFLVSDGYEMFVSDDLGLTWNELGFLALNFAVAPDDPNIMYRMGIDCIPYRSDNGGATWTPLPSPAPHCYTGVYTDPNEGDYVYLTSQYRQVARSLDGGQSWQDLDGRDNNGPYVWSFAIDPKDSTRLYVGQGVYVSILLDNSSYIPAIWKD